MLRGVVENVTVTVPTTAGQVDPHTKEVLSGGGTTTYTVPVVWVTNPRRALVYDADQGVIHGFHRVEEAALLYEPQGLDSDVDWSVWLRPDVTVTRKAEAWVPVSLSEDPRHSRQVVTLRKVEGGLA